MCDDRVHHQDRINLIRSMAFFLFFLLRLYIIEFECDLFFYFAFIVIETRDYWSKLKSKANFIDWCVNWRWITIVAKSGHRFRQPFRFDWANYSVVTRDRYNESLKLKCVLFRGALPCKMHKFSVQGENFWANVTLSQFKLFSTSHPSISHFRLWSLIILWRFFHRSFFSLFRSTFNKL